MLSCGELLETIKVFNTFVDSALPEAETRPLQHRSGGQASPSAGVAQVFGSLE